MKKLPILAALLILGIMGCVYLKFAVRRLPRERRE